MSSIKFGNFISNNYDVIKQINVSKPSEAEWFFLCGRHQDYGIRKTNSLFLRTVAEKDDIILLEGTPSLQKINPLKTVLITLNSKNFNVVGWDIDSESFEKYGMTVSEGQREEAVKSNGITYKLIETKLEEKEKSKLENELLESLMKTMESMEQKIKQQREQQQKPLNQFKIAALTFDNRTQFLIKSCQIASDKGCRKFLVAGEGHLREMHSVNEILGVNSHLLLKIPEIKEDAENALRIGNKCYKTFQTFIENKKAVILRPKKEVTEPFNQKAQKLILKIMQKYYSTLKSSLSDEELSSSDESL